MSKVIIRAPDVDTVIIGGVKSFKVSEYGTAFYSEDNYQGVCRGVAPNKAVLEMIIDDE